MKKNQQVPIYQGEGKFRKIVGYRSSDYKTIKSESSEQPADEYSFAKGMLKGAIIVGGMLGISALSNK